jgi:signal transduction histidine kinase
MEEHGGSINASSETGRGTTMILRFKRYKPE